MDQPIYQRIVTESHLDAECQKFVEREFPKAVRAVNRFSGKANPPAAVKPAEGRRDGR